MTQTQGSLISHIWYVDYRKHNEIAKFVCQWVPKAEHKSIQATPLYLYFADACNTGRLGFMPAELMSNSFKLFNQANNGAFCEKIYANEYRLVEGQIYFISGRKKLSVTNSIRSAGQFIRVREKGPLYKISMDLPPGAQRTHASVLGRFDLVNLADIKDEIININISDAASANPSSVEHLFKIEMIEPEIQAAPRLESRSVIVSGDAVEVKGVNLRRRIKI